MLFEMFSHIYCLILNASVLSGLMLMKCFIYAFSIVFVDKNKALLLLYFLLLQTKLGFYVPFNSQGHIGTGPQNCHLWDSNPQR